jgi:site-specific DNA-methyltransferase (adenine-specific)
VLIFDDCFNYLTKISSGSIDLIITDPPYDISKNSNFSKLSSSTSSEMKTKYGNHTIDFGYWDTMIDLNKLFSEYYRVLRKGGTVIIFYDIWKCNLLKESATKSKFKQPRIGQWLKTNPVPVNSKLNYLSNCSEYFFTFVKDKKPTFNSEYDNAIYNFPLCHGKERLEHPTQKPLGLIKSLILKHSNSDDVVLDTFSGTSTTAIACLETNRNYICVERDEKYFEISKNRIENYKQKNEISI